MALINTTTTGVLGTTVFGDGQGALTVQKDGVTQGVYGNIPAFSAYSSVSQTITNSVLTKLTFDTEEFDTNNNFTSSRFTPTVAGYYQVNGCCSFANSPSNAQCIVFVFKNGIRFKDGSWGYLPTVTNTGSNVSALVYCNGTTDYLELYGWQNSSGSISTGVATPSIPFFQACLVKAV